MNKPTCLDCMYWELSGDPDHEDMGECRRNCPTYVSGHDYGMWPITGPLDWCGEYKQDVEVK